MPKKCMVLYLLGFILGYSVCKQGKLQDQSKIKGIINLSPPQDQKGVQCLLSLAQFYHMFIKGLAKIMKPIFDLNRPYYKCTMHWPRKNEHMPLPNFTSPHMESPFSRSQ